MSKIVQFFFLFCYSDTCQKVRHAWWESNHSVFLTMTRKKKKNRGGKLKYLCSFNTSLSFIAYIAKIPPTINRAVCVGRDLNAVQYIYWVVVWTSWWYEQPQYLWTTWNLPYCFCYIHYMNKCFWLHLFIAVFRCFSHGLS